MKILGIETSCDETAVAIVDGEKNILSHVLNSQIEIHRKFGGVVPEIAARGHVEIIDDLILQALKEANLTFEDIDAFAATSGPGLIGGVIVGLMAAKTLASIFKKPFIAVNHLEGHALTVRLTNEIEFPYLLLLISGGHCQILLAKDLGNYEKLGETIDDALGECFDKVAQMLGLPYPGGPEVEKMAREGDEKRFKFSRPLIDVLNRDHLCDFSFSGLKTAVRREIEKLIGEEFSHLTSPQKISQKDKVDICASFQRVVCEVILNRLSNIDLEKFKAKDLVIAGGVAANRYIFSSLQNWASARNINLIAPPIKLCTDNAAMIAWVGVEKFKRGIFDDLNFKPKARWELAS
jgi:N6-L-threonylcarbamoyladenine synthase